MFKNVLSRMKKNTQNPLSRIKEKYLENGQARQDKELKLKMGEEMGREDTASVYICIYTQCLCP